MSKNNENKKSNQKTTMNKIACAIMVSLSGTCFLKGEIAPPETEWKGARLIYEGVSIQNEVTLPQKGVQEAAMRKGVVLQGHQPHHYQILWSDRRA